MELTVLVEWGLLNPGKYVIKAIDRAGLGPFVGVRGVRLEVDTPGTRHNSLKGILPR